MYAITDLIVSGIAFSFGCFMVYQVLARRARWDAFWEEQNRGRPFAPDSWAGSPFSKALTYLVAFVALLGGLAGLCRSFHIF